MEETTRIATRLLDHIRSDLLETDESFGVDSDLFAAGLDSMSIMQIILFIEEEFAVKLPDFAITRAAFGTARHLAEIIRRTRLIPSPWQGEGEGGG
jgi:acyl carrier protein